MDEIPSSISRMRGPEGGSGTNPRRYLEIEWARRNQSGRPVAVARPSACKRVGQVGMARNIWHDWPTRQAVCERARARGRQAGHGYECRGVGRAGSAARGRPCAEVYRCVSRAGSVNPESIPGENPQDILVWRKSGSLLGQERDQGRLLGEIPSGISTLTDRPLTEDREQTIGPW